MSVPQSELLPTGRPRIHKMEMEGITKRFPGVLANDNVDFDVSSGEVHALLGENGAGKSTLMKILYGLYSQNEGDIWLNGERAIIQSPGDAMRLGIGMIHQHFMLVDSLTVAENVALGLSSSRGFITDLDVVAERVMELGGIYGLQVEPDAYIWQLSVGQQQRVEIIKALYRGAALLILDEPTAVLTPQEVDEFFITMRQMVTDGHALIFISHKLHEVIDICDRVTVLRDGRVVGSRSTKNATKGILAEMMVGRELGSEKEKADVVLGDVQLKVENLRALSNRETPALRGVNFEVRSGEILGLAGVSGNGQPELAEVITGLRPTTHGNVFLKGRDITQASPREITNSGMAYIPEERMRDGMIKDFSVAENLILREHHQLPYSQAGFLNLKEVSANADALIESYNVKTPSQDTLVKNLSGGNIQKLVLARELSRKPDVLIASQPTRGLDIGATEYVHERLLEQREAGRATLLISEDLDEILALADRIIVMFEGSIMGELPRAAATAEKLGLLMAGIAEEQQETA